MRGCPLIWPRRRASAGGVPGSVPDPGNPDGVLWIGRDADGRHWLVGLDGTPGADGVRETVRILIPDGITDPVEAAAWTYSVTPDVYRQLARRT